MARFLSERALIPWQGAGEVLPADNVIRIPAAPPEPAQTYHETREPRRDPKVESDVVVPALQTALTGAAVGVMAGLLALALGWGWQVPAVAVALALGAGWLWRLRLVDSLLWQVESWVDHDLNGDGNTGRPVVSYMLANPADARAAVAKESRQEADDERRAALETFLNKCYVVGCSEGAHGIKATGPDLAAYVAQRDVLLSLGIAQWRNPERPRAGWTLAVNRFRAAQLLKKHVL